MLPENNIDMNKCHIYISKFYPRWKLALIWLFKPVSKRVRRMWLGRAQEMSLDIVDFTYTWDPNGK